jgi:glucose-6-phosphate isomerase
MKPVEINDLPTSVWLDINTGVFEPCVEISRRKVSDLAMMFADQGAVQQLIAQGDPVVYDIRYHPFQTSTSDMALGVSTIYPGKVGDEYHMTKGHFHVRMDQPEIYFCVRGTGFLLMESKEGDFQVAEWRPGTITHIPPQYAHRVVNTGPEPLIWVASYHLAAGHDYEPIIARGFAKIVVEKDGQPVFLPNPRRPNSS